METFKRFVAKNGKEVILRSPTRKDVISCLRYINSLIEEDAPVLENKKKTLKEEKQFIRETLEGIKNRNRVVVIAQVDGKVAGTVDIQRGRGRKSHIGKFGVGVLKEYRRSGVGTELTKMVIKLAKKRLKIEKVDLDVFSVNKGAYKLYRKIGFKKIARIPKNGKYKGKEIDSIRMRLLLKKFKN